MKVELTREELFDAVYQGVKDAFLTMMDAGNGINGPIRMEEVKEKIRQGVEDAFDYKVPSKEELKDIYYDAIRNSQ
jgi:hypothetical protein